jgi:hypothetical protein
MPVEWDYDANAWKPCPLFPNSTRKKMDFVGEFMEEISMDGFQNDNIQPSTKEIDTAPDSTSAAACIDVGDSVGGNDSDYIYYSDAPNGDYGSDVDYATVVVAAAATGGDEAPCSPIAFGSSGAAENA